MDIYNASGKDIALAAARDACEKLLSECTAEQQAFFLRLYPGGLAKMDLAKVCNAIDQCQRTLKKNMTKETGKKRTSAHEAI